METITLAFSFLAASADPIKDKVLEFIASYGGIAMGVTFLISGVKALWKSWVDGKEGYLTIILALVLGTVGKLVTDVYGDSSVKAWALHLMILLFVAIGAAAFHDKVLNVLIGKNDAQGGKK